MTTNAKVILDELLEKQRAEIASHRTLPQYFEIFSAEQILKDYDLSYEEIEAGLVGGGGDGGIDAVYILVNGELVQEDTELPTSKNVILDLILIEAKTTDSFAETAVNRFITTTQDLLNLSKNLDSLVGQYNESLLTVARRFREVYRSLVTRFPRLRISYHYATKGSEVHPNARRRAAALQETVKSLFSEVECAFQFLGARELLELARRSPSKTFTLSLAETPISSAGDVAFVCLVRLKDFYAFITDENRSLRRNIFEANVRDYQKGTEVNDEIQESLQESKGEDFWWLNNGVTIVAAKATHSGKALTIEDPQIVNGLQTSQEIYLYFNSANTETEGRNLLVRVLVPAKGETRDRVIKATNRQTPISAASLRSTDKIHRDIEEYLRVFGLYYDRRKNFYKNEGKPIEAIISIGHLAQAVMSITLQRPNTARARPSSLLKNDEDYRALFSEQNPIQMYLVCANLARRVETFLKRDDLGLEARNRNNLRFYVAMHIGAIVAGKLRPSAQDVAGISVDKIRDDALIASFEPVRVAYQTLGGTDQVAKGSGLVERIQQDLESRLTNA